MGKLLRVLGALAVLLALVAHQDGGRADELTESEELESEMQLKRMLAYVTPLMAIVRKDHRITRDAPGDAEEGRQYYGNGQYGNYAPSSYAKNGYGGGGGGYSSCCQKKDDLLPLLALLGLAGLLLYLLLIASTTTTKAGRKRRGLDDNDIDMTADVDLGISFLSVFFWPAIWSWRREMGNRCA